MFDLIVQKRNIIFTITGLFILLAGAILTFVNNGFYYADFNQKISVKYSAYQDELAKLDNVSKIDRKNNKIYFERTSLVDLENNIKNKLGEEKLADFGILEVKPSNKNDLLRNIIVLSIVSVAALNLILIYYSISRRKKISTNYYIKLSSLILLTVLLNLATLSILSLIYQIKEYQLYLHVISLVVIIFMLYRYLGKKEMQFFAKDDLSFLKEIIIVWFVIFAPLIFSMQENFIILGILITLQLVYTFVATSIVMNLDVLNARSIKTSASEISIQNTKTHTSRQITKHSNKHKAKKKKNV